MSRVFGLNFGLIFEAVPHGMARFGASAKGQKRWIHMPFLKCRRTMGIHNSLFCGVNIIKREQADESSVSARTLAKPDFGQKWPSRGVLEVDFGAPGSPLDVDLELRFDS